MTQARQARAQRPPTPSYAGRTAEILAAARDLLETEGTEALTMRRIGEALGIRAPSLYKHLPGKGAVEVALVEAGLHEMGAACHRAVQRPGRRTTLAALLAAYRAQARAHPHLYRLATAGPLARDQLSEGLEEWAGEPWFLVTGDPYVAQALWSAAHGAVILELDDRYPPGSNLDRTWRALAHAFGG